MEKHRILIIEDNADTRRFLEAMLGKEFETGLGNLKSIAEKQAVCKIARQGRCRAVHRSCH